MTSGPDPQPEPTQPFGATPPPPPPPQPGYQQSNQQPYQQPYQQPVPPGGYGVSPQAPYGIHPGTGVPYSDKSKVVAGVLNILIPFGIGRFYTGYTGLGIAQALVALFTCGLWSIIDGILMLVKDDPRDARGYVLRS
jgi:TM2 domain-containing membrane protein YozV